MVKQSCGYRENYRPDYSQTNTPDCSGFIKGGEIRTCTITNDDLAPARLTVIKHVINDNSGTMTAADFTLFVNGNYPSPWMFQGYENGTDVIIYPGWYSVYEDYYPQYSTTLSDNCYGDIYSGETRICTITNDDI